MKRFRNFGYSLLYTALKTEAGAQPPGLTEKKTQYKTSEKHYISTNKLFYLFSKIEGIRKTKSRGGGDFEASVSMIS